MGIITTPLFNPAWTFVEYTAMQIGEKYFFTGDFSETLPGPWLSAGALVAYFGVKSRSKGIKLASAGLLLGLAVYYGFDALKNFDAEKYFQTFTDGLFAFQSLHALTGYRSGSPKA